ncbi:MAG: acetylglutamate kinase [Ruminococcaceae bacterium]|nr:acetylglutamate kinase [Oscillospiraceae bacterium]
MSSFLNHAANQLTHAMPYIVKYRGKTIVVKYGGNAMLNEELKEAVMYDIALLTSMGIRVVLVHGGGPEISGTLKKMGKESKFINGLRYTDEETVGVVQMVLAGKTNKDLAALLHLRGTKAVGLCGIDGGMIRAAKLEGEVDLGYVGEVLSINSEPINHAIEGGYVPVIATVGLGDDGTVYNINADTAAARIAAELGAERLILMTDTAGLLADKDNEDTLIAEVNVSEVPYLKSEGIISGGMIPKVECCVEAVRRGVGSATIIDGRKEHSILMELLSDEGSGTQFI